MCTESEEIGVFGDGGVGHGVVAEAAFLGLDADVDHRFGRGAFEVAVGAGGDADDRALGDVEHIVVDLELATAREDDVVLLVLFVAVEEGNGYTGGECAEGDFARSCAGGVLHKLLALECAESTDGCVGKLCALVECLDFAHDF